jgi:hypothetical protein
MKKLFTEPVIKVDKFLTENILTTSGNGVSYNGNEADDVENTSYSFTVSSKELF